MFINIKKFKKSINSISNKKGMTLVELMVVLSIFVIVSGIVIFDYGSFRSAVSLQNLADDIALSVRRAQSYAIGVHDSPQLASMNFKSGYGIHFSTYPVSDFTKTLEGSNKSFILFADIPDAGGYMDKTYNYDQSSISSLCDNTTLSSGNECLDILNINSTDVVDSICPGGSVEGTCYSGYENPGFVDIVFLRPNPDANICVNINNSSFTCDTPLSRVDIIIKNIQSGKIKTITISNTGQIGIK